MNVYIPLEFSKMNGGMLQSALSLAVELNNDDSITPIAIAIEGSEVFEEFINNNIKTIGISFIENFDHPFISKLITHLINNFRLYRLFSKLKLTPNDVILVNNLGFLLYFGIIPFNGNLVFISRGGNYSGLTGYMAKFIFNYRVRKIICVSMTQEKMIRKIAPKADVIIIPNGIEATTKTINNSYCKKWDGIIHLSVIGFFNENKNQLFALKILKGCIENYGPSFFLNFYGESIAKSDFKYTEKLLEYIRNNRLGEYVNFHNYVKDKNLIYNNTHIVLAPSYREGFGRTIIESFLFRVPCIASSIAGGPSDIIDDNMNGFLLDISSPNPWIDKIIQIRNNAKMRDMVINNAEMKFLKNFSIENVGAKYITELKGL